MYVIATADMVFERSCQAAIPQPEELYPGHVRDMHTLEMLLKRPQPIINILMLDKTILEENGVHKITSFNNLRPEMHIILFVDELDQREEISAILFGAKAYCAKSMDFGELPRIFKAVLRGEVWVDRLFVTRLLFEIQDISHAKHEEAQHLDREIQELTKRETQIAELVANGATNRDIASQLKITERTVKAHLGTIFKKMHVKDRLQLAICLNRHHQIPAIWHGMVEESKKNKP